MLNKFYVLRQEASAEAVDGGGGDLAPAPSEGLLANDPAPTPEPTATDPAPPQPAASIEFPENWKEGIDAELRDDPSLKLVNDIPTLVKNYVHAQKNIAKRGVPLPDQHATDEDRRQFFQKLGLPESVDKYDVKVPKDASFEEGFLSEFKKAAHEANILPDQAQKLLDWYNQTNSSAIEQAITQNKTEAQAELKALKQEWGSDYDRNIKVARAVLRTAGMEDVNQWLQDSGLDNSAMMIKLMSSVGNLMKEDGVIDLGDNVGPSGKEIQSRIQELEGNVDGPLYKKNHPNHAAAVKEREALYNQLYPSQV